MAYGDEAPSFATVWRDLVDDGTSHGLNAEDPLSSTSDYADFLSTQMLSCALVS